MRIKEIFLNIYGFAKLSSLQICIMHKKLKLFAQPDTMVLKFNLKQLKF